MGKQRRNGHYKDGTAYSRADKEKDVVHPVDMSEIKEVICQECEEPPTTIDAMLAEKNCKRALVFKSWTPLKESCKVCVEKVPYRVIGYWGHITMVHPRKKVHQVMAHVELRSAMSLLLALERAGAKPANIECGKDRVRSTKMAFRGVGDCHGRPKELIEALRQELKALDDDRDILTKSRIDIMCLDGRLSYSLNTMVLGSEH